MKYMLCYVRNSHDDDFIAAVDPTGKDTVKILDKKYFPPNFIDKHNYFDFDEIGNFMSNVKDISKWENSDCWYTEDDIEDRNGRKYLCILHMFVDVAENGGDIEYLNDIILHREIDI